MNSLESVRTLILDYLRSSRNTFESSNYLGMIGDKHFQRNVYDAFFNLIADPTHSPEKIIHQLDTYTSGLDGFSTSTCLQTVISFACVEGLARRKPGVLKGPWENLAWMILKFTSISHTEMGNRLTAFKKTNKATPAFINNYISPELCPNPCLRLELFRLMSSFNCKYIYYDRGSFRDKIINTFVEISDTYSSFTVDQLPYFSPYDLQYVMEDHSINMKFIMNDCELETKKSEIIASVLKITRNLALLEKERHLTLNNGEIDEFWYVGLGKQLSTCLSFGGLLSDNYETCLLDLVQVVGNNHLLLNYMIDTLDIIKQISLCFPDNSELQALTMYKKDKLLHTLFKRHIKKVPIFQYKQEINGGISPAIENQLRYFQDNARGHYHYHDSDYESESYVSDENDYIYPFNTQGNDSEIYFSE